MVPKVEKKAAEKDVLKQKLIKVGKGAGNLNKVKAEVDTLGAAMVDRPKVKTETGKVVFSKFDFVSDEVVPDSIGKKKTLDLKAALAKIAASKEKLKDMAEAGKTDKVFNKGRTFVQGAFCPMGICPTAGICPRLALNYFLSSQYSVLRLYLSFPVFQTLCPMAI